MTDVQLRVNTRCNAPTQKGFTLFEVMVAVAILAVTALSVLKANQYYQKHTERADLKIKAEIMAENQLSLLKIKSAAWINNSGGVIEQSETYKNMGKQWKVQYRIRPDTLSRQLKVVTISVYLDGEKQRLVVKDALIFVPELTKGAGT